MPKHKELKRLVRARMRKTGESYTSARAKLVAKHRPVRADHAKLTGMSDATIRAKTGKTWKQWVRVLDDVDATRMTHGDTAKHLHEQYDLPSWWAQTVTVGYERLRGLRDIGQRRDGSYEASKARTIAVALPKLYRACHDKRTRQRWLPVPDLEVRTSQPQKSMRMTWRDGTSVELYFTAKGSAKSHVAIQHRKLPSKAAATAMKQYWHERLDVLAAQLERSSATR